MMTFLCAKKNITEDVARVGRSLFKRRPGNIPALLIILISLFFCSTVLSATGTPQGGAGIKLQEDLLSVSFPTEKTGWVSGRWGTIIHTEDGGKTWSRQKSGTDYTLCSIFFVDQKRGWAVGDGGTIVSTVDGGNTWTKQQSPVPFFLQSVHFADAQQGWIVTEKTHILHTGDGGKTWTVQFKGEDYMLKSVSFVDEKNGWAVGEYGLIYHTANGGKTWEQQAGGLSFSEETGEILAGNILFDVFAISPGSAWVAGIDGYLAKTEDAGKTWRQITTGIPKIHMFFIRGDKARTVLTGGKGVFLISFDNGQSWHPSEFKPPITYSWIYKVTSRGNAGYVAVGARGAIYVSTGTGDKIVWQKARY
jgi:photosystem II stability/assembly factor-like uncharacterized protein